jgi:hypothetical protein
MRASTASARVVLGVSPVHRFVASRTPLDLKCGYVGASNVVRFGAGRVMRWVRFSEPSVGPE